MYAQSRLAVVDNVIRDLRSSPCGRDASVHQISWIYLHLSKFNMVAAYLGFS